MLACLRAALRCIFSIALRPREECSLRAWPQLFLSPYHPRIVDSRLLRARAPELPRELRRLGQPKGSNRPCSAPASRRGEEAHLSSGGLSLLGSSETSDWSCSILGSFTTKKHATPKKRRAEGSTLSPDAAPCS